MPPPEEKPKPAKGTKPKVSVERYLELVEINEEKIRLFYFREKTEGRPLGYNTMLEIVFGHLSAAKKMAREGKEWEPA